MRRLRSGLLALLTALCLMALLTVPAVDARTTASPTAHRALASCSGAHCNGLDAYSTGCAGSGASYWVVESVPVVWNGTNDGWDQLWYSGTCGTNWARYACSSSCRTLILTLMVCNADGSQTGVQGPVELSATGRTPQHYLPRTPASADVLFQVATRGFSGTDTGCY